MIQGGQSYRGAHPGRPRLVRARPLAGLHRGGGGAGVYSAVQCCGVVQVTAALERQEGVRHCLQAGVDRVNQAAPEGTGLYWRLLSCVPSAAAWVTGWEVKATSLSYATGELLPGGAPHTALVLARYSHQLAALFSSQQEPPTPGHLQENCSNINGPTLILGLEMKRSVQEIL